MPAMMHVGRRGVMMLIKPAQSPDDDVLPSSLRSKVQRASSDTRPAIDRPA
jgi:hypothetical protein